MVVKWYHGNGIIALEREGMSLWWGGGGGGCINIARKRVKKKDSA